MDRRQKTALIAILFLGLLLRLWGIRFGLPYLYHPDEHKIVSTALGFGTGDFNPHFFNYPTFYIYFQFLLYGIWYGFGRLIGLFSSPYEFAYQYIADPTAIHLIGRSATALLGAGTVLMVFLLARKLSSVKTALIAAAFTGSSFLLIQDSHFITTDIPMTFFIVASALAAIGYAQTGRLKTLLLAALFAGVAASTKYNGILSAATVAAAALAAPSESTGAQKIKRLAGSMALVLAAFFCASPFVLLDIPAFKIGILFEYRHAHFGHLGFFGDEVGWWFHLRTSLAQGIGWPILLSGGATLTEVLFRPRSRLWILTLFPVLYFAFIGASNTLFDRYAIPLVPFLALFSAIGISAAADKLGKKNSAFLIAGLILCIGPNLARAIKHDMLLTRTDTRTQAARWIEKTVAPGSVIFVDSYGPQLTPIKPEAKGTPVGREIKEQIRRELAQKRIAYRVTNLSLEGQFYPDWIRTRAPDYLVVSSYIVDRLRERSTRQKNPNPFVEWIDRDLPAAKVFSPYSSEVKSPDSFNVKSLTSPAAGDLWNRNRPGPVIRIFGPLAPPPGE